MAQKTATAADNDDRVDFSFSIDDAKKSILETGAYVTEDASAGRRVSEFIETNQLSFREVDGLTFCAQNSFYDKGIRDVIESNIDRPHWGLAKLYNSAILPSDVAYFFIDGPEMRSIFILLFTSNTELLLFEKSHCIRIPGKQPSAFGLLTLPHEKLNREDIARVSYDLSEGGFAIIDGRVGWTILRGQQIALGYASEEEIAFWADIRLRDTAPLRVKVDELRANGMKAKFKFVDRHGTSANV